MQPDWMNYNTGYNDGLQEACDKITEHINYADSTMSHEELLQFVAKMILYLKR